MQYINLDVEQILTNNTIEVKNFRKDIHSNQNVETPAVMLRKNAVNRFIIKEMNLNSHIFFQNTGNPTFNCY